MKTVRILIVLALIGAAFLTGRWYSRRSAAPAAAGGRKVLYWVDPMHPAYKSDKPGVAPDCGMKLVPVYADEARGPETAAPPPPGAIRVTPEKQQLIGVRYGTVERAAGVDTIRAVGKVAIDETRIAHVHSRTEGWIDKVYVDFTGDVVRKGQPMLTLYSPELLASEHEYLLAIQARRTIKASTVPGAAADSEAMVAAARRRLELWELSDAQIDQVERSGKPVTNVTLYSPASGYVTARNAFANQKAMPDTELYTVVDLSRVWVQASIFEYQAPLVRLGQAATVALPYASGRTYRARVSYIQPQVDPATRTLLVRLELANPGLVLKPEMFVNVELAAPQPPRLTVPVEAVLDTGLKRVVFVARGDGYFEPREVETGDRIGDRVQVLKGLATGEKIVTSGNFMLSSESQLKMSAQGMGAMPEMPGMAKPPAGAPAPAPAPGSMPNMPGMQAPAAPPAHTGHGARQP